MKTISAETLCAAVGGEWLFGDGASAVTGLTTDSRVVRAGEVFLPVIGERFDGHDYIGAALAAGASGCLCARVPEQYQEGKFYIRVADTRLALKALAQWYRAQFSIPFVQLTGSVGKTTTKEMVARVLSEHVETLWTEGNLNSDLGVPQTLLRLDDTHRAAVIETGMDHFGQIRALGEMVRPDIALITNIGDAHIEFLGSREGILQAKCEIFEALAPDGLAVLNGDDPLLNTVTLPQRVVRCGLGEGCDVRVSEVAERGVAGVDCTVTTARAVYRLAIPAPGAHMIYPAAMAVAVGEALGLSAEEITRGVAQYAPSGNRMRVERLPGGRVLLNDSYNASPQAMEAAVRILASGGTGKRIAMLGDMKEIGDASEECHRRIGQLVGELGVDTLFCVGPDCRAYLLPEAQRCGCTDAHWYETKEAAYPDLVAAYTEGSTLLLKAAHFSGRFDLVADYLRAYPF